jgi:hypothetical protein
MIAWNAGSKLLSTIELSQGVYVGLVRPMILKIRGGSESAPKFGLP